ncbi:MAG: nucleotidyl transferase AbiEii/AbiGii toxin family protein [Alkalimonas sp.]|nr:nucleotidyl transferase AbiEii/AbiGii toxin family protein [Alkalimonas sp.]
MSEAYKGQVRLLLDVLPEVAKESCFAMHGGTAINLFVRDMPRLSVDIDLTYVEIAGRSETFERIHSALSRIKARVEGLLPSVRVQHKEDICKLLLDDQGTTIKIEVNTIGRGLLGPATKAPLCDSAQKAFDVFCVMPIVPLEQLYGGKLCAALDRQHPRDLFDVKLLLDNEGFTDDIKRGFLFGLLSSNRPTYEMLTPNLLDQRTAFERQFAGMSAIAFSYEDYEATRLQLIETINASFDEKDKEFVLSLNRLEPDWSIYDFQNFPSVKWKILNLAAFKKKKPDSYQQQLVALEGILGQ